MGKRVEAQKGLANELIHILQDKKLHSSNVCQKVNDILNYNSDPIHSIKSSLGAIAECMSEHTKEKTSLQNQVENLQNQNVNNINAGFNEFNANKAALGLPVEISDIKTANQVLATLKSYKANANKLPVCESQKTLAENQYNDGHQAMNKYCQDHKKEAQIANHKYAICKELCNSGWTFDNWDNDCISLHEEL